MIRPPAERSWVEGDILRAPAFHRQLFAEAVAAGNSPIDCLYVVPPELARAGADGVTPVARVLAGEGINCWDGTSYDVRRDMPRDIAAPRIVQYESCRGLESWTVLATGLDRFWELRLQQAGGGAGQALDGADEAAHQAAARWMMIPLSRAMDTLVVSVARSDSEIGQLLDRAARALPDIVSWVR
jgi:hypothetical protein